MRGCSIEVAVVGDYGRQGGGVAVGARLVWTLADELGLTAGLSEAMAHDQRRRGHDRGQVLVDMAVAIADGATTPDRVRVAVQPEL